MCGVRTVASRFAETECGDCRHVIMALQGGARTPDCGWSRSRWGNRSDMYQSGRPSLAPRDIVLAKLGCDPRRAERGFTLLELLVVLAILGLLIGLVAPAALRQLGSAKEKIAHQSIERLATVLDIYKLDVGSYPTTEQGLQALIARPSGVARWSGPYLKGDKLPEDPWGRPFVYRSPSQRPGHEFDLYSLGPTGQPGGPGDSAAIYNE